jgi:hypothetical protein
MYVLLSGLRESVPHLPTAWPADRAVSKRIALPEFEE